MSHSLRILNVEDNPVDTELVESLLTADGVACDVTRVEKESEFVMALQSHAFDLIVGDYSLPSFDGLSALAIARALAPEIPFIFVSGTSGDDIAIEALKQGATDYVLKHRFDRLVPCVKRALDEVEQRKRREHAEADMRTLLRREHDARAEAEAANRAKDEFIAVVSHELRTPLTAMLGWTRMLRGGQLDANASKHALEVIERNLRQQTQILTDLLDVSRIISGKLRLDPEVIELRPVIETALDVVRPAADAKDISISTALDARIGVLFADATRLQQVFWNLMSNAVKFTPAGGRVDVRLDRANGHARVSVIDSGPGISPEFLPQLFQRFQQGESGTTRRYGGLGLGLAIVRHIVELHGGQVSACSGGEGTGATFVVELPLETSGSEVVRNALSEGAYRRDRNPKLHRIRVLLVDDRQDTVEFLAGALAEYGAEVGVAGSVPEALRILRESRPDVLVSDLSMPGEDGFSLMRRIRSHPGGAPSPVAIALTAHARVEDRDNAVASGFDLYLSKPIEPERLAFAIEALVRPPA
jgi:signal transduction histidine kinase